MHSFALRAALSAALSLPACAAWALEAPPIKTGLWQTHMERMVDGKPAPAPGARFAKMPPEQRARMEAMMKQRGMDMAGMEGGDTKVCLDAQSLDAGSWQGREGDCKTDYLTRSASLWKWHSSCKQSAIESDGEARFESDKSYVVKIDSTHTVGGVARKSQMTLTSKWLGADCGNVKPFHAPR